MPLAAVYFFFLRSNMPPRMIARRTRTPTTIPTITPIGTPFPAGGFVLAESRVDVVVALVSTPSELVPTRVCVGVLVVPICPAVLVVVDKEVFDSVEVTATILVVPSTTIVKDESS
jgi:hypothetical protein